MDTNEILNDILPAGWEHDGYGFDSILICPHGDPVELDGGCPEGCISPLIDLGMI